MLRSLKPSSELDAFVASKTGVPAKMIREGNEASRADLDAKFENYIADKPKTSKRATTEIARDLLTSN